MGRPTEGEASRCLPSLSMSQPLRTVRPPRRRTEPASSKSSVTTSRPAASAAKSCSASRRISSSAVKRPEYRTSTPEATRRETRPCSGEPSRTTTTATPAGTMARSRPISAAAGSAEGERVRAWRTFVPSTTSRSMPSRTFRSSGMESAGSGPQIDVRRRARARPEARNASRPLEDARRRAQARPESRNASRLREDAGRARRPEARRGSGPLEGAGCRAPGPQGPDASGSPGRGPARRRRRGRRQTFRAPLR